MLSVVSDGVSGIITGGETPVEMGVAVSYILTVGRFSTVSVGVFCVISLSLSSRCIGSVFETRGHRLCSFGVEGLVVMSLISVGMDVSSSSSTTASSSSYGV